MRKVLVYVLRFTLCVSSLRNKKAPVLGRRGRAWLAVAQRLHSLLHTGAPTLVIEVITVVVEVMVGRLFMSNSTDQRRINLIYTIKVVRSAVKRYVIASTRLRHPRSRPGV